MKNVINFAIFGVLLVFCLFITSNSHASGVLYDEAILTKSFAAVGAHGTGQGIEFDGEYYFAIWGGTGNDPIVQYDAGGNYVTEAYPEWPNYMYSGMQTIFHDGDDLIVVGQPSPWGATLIHKVNKSDLMDMPTIGTVGYKLPDSGSGGSFQLQGDTLYARADDIIYELDWPNGNYVDEFTLDTLHGRWACEITLGLAGDHILTYYIEPNETVGAVQAFDFDGNLVGESTLEISNTNGQQAHSFSYTDGLVWMLDEGEWKGYDVGLNAVPIPGAVWLLGSGLVALVGIRRRNSN